MKKNQQRSYTKFRKGSKKRRQERRLQTKTWDRETKRIVADITDNPKQERKAVNE